MKTYYKRALLITCFVTLYPASPQATREKFVIGAHHPKVGFFGLFLGTLSNLAWCNKHGKTPVIYWGECLYSKPEDPFANNWEHFFEPVSDLSFSNEDPIYCSHKAKDGFFVPSMGRRYQENFDMTFRLEMNKVLRKYVKIKAHIQKTIDDFYDKHIKRQPTIGVHIRRSDKIEEAAEVPLEQFIQLMNKFPDYQYLVASDVANVIDELKKRFGDKIIAYDAYRSQDNAPIHYKHEIDRVGAGIDVLIEVVLLSRCDFFIHGCSNVATAVLVFNPCLNHEYLSADDTKLWNKTKQWVRKNASPVALLNVMPITWAWSTLTT